MCTVGNFTPRWSGLVHQGNMALSLIKALPLGHLDSGTLALFLLSASLSRTGICHASLRTNWKRRPGISDYSMVCVQVRMLHVIDGEHTYAAILWIVRGRCRINIPPSLLYMVPAIAIHHSAICRIGMSICGLKKTTYKATYSVQCKPGETAFEGKE